MGALYVGLFLLGVLAFVIICWVVMAKGWRAVQSYDRKKAVEREVEQAYKDANTRQNHARRMLSDYDKD